MRIYKRTVFFFSLTLFSITTFSQAISEKNSGNQFGITAELGLSVPSDKKINDVFNAGLNVAIGFKIPPFQKTRFSLKPVLGAKWYFKEIESTNSFTEHFRTWKAGLELQYSIFSNEHISLYPFVRIDHNWSANYYSKNYNYNPWTNTSSVAYSDKYLKGTGISYDAGCKIIFKNKWYLKADYEFYKPELRIDSKLIEASLADGYYVEAKQKLNFSSLNITAGININFK